MIGYRTRVYFFLFAALPAIGAERWMEIRMAGQPAGYLREEIAAAERIVTTAKSHIVMNRLGSKADISSSAQSTSIEGRIERGALALTISTGGKSYNRSVRLTEPLLGPEQARKRSRMQCSRPSWAW